MQAELEARRMTITVGLSSPQDLTTKNPQSKRVPNLVMLLQFPKLLGSAEDQGGFKKLGSENAQRRGTIIQATTREGLRLRLEKAQRLSLSLQTQSERSISPSHLLMFPLCLLETESEAGVSITIADTLPSLSRRKLLLLSRLPLIWLRTLRR
jgi:hypothetical protein